MASFGNFHLWAIPAAFLSAYWPAFVRNFMIVRLAGRYNNLNPRGQVSELTASQKLSSDDSKFLDRCSGAHNNGLEVFPFFAAAVLFALHRGLPVATLNNYSVAFLAVRTLFNLAYIGGNNRIVSTLRSGLWAVSVAVMVALYISAI